MSAGLLFVWTFFVWALWAVAGILGAEVQNRRDPLPDGSRRGMSCAPIIPLFPLLFWGAAKAIDFWAYPWGTKLIAGMHAVLAVVFIAGILFHACQLLMLRVRQKRKLSEPE